MTVTVVPKVTEDLGLEFDTQIHNCMLAYAQTIRFNYISIYFHSRS